MSLSNAEDGRRGWLQLRGLAVTAVAVRATRSADVRIPNGQTSSSTTETTQTGAIAHVVFIDGSNVFKTDLVIITSGAQLLVDDIYCTGQDPSTTDAYASGWDVRSVCQGA